MALDSILLSFNGGEVSAESEGRLDIEKYRSSCIKMENFIPKLLGGAFRRPGTVMAAPSKYGSYRARNMPFSFSTIQSYNFEFGRYYIRFFKDKGQVLVASADAFEFDPAIKVNTCLYYKVGNYVARNCGSSKILYIASEYGQVSTGVTIAVSSNSSDALAVSASTLDITIKLANSTPAKNSANLIQTALRALKLVGTVDVSGWTVTENAAYAAARPTTGVSVAGAALTTLDKIYKTIKVVESSTTNTGKFPPIETTYWEEVDIGDVVEILSPYTDEQIQEIEIVQDADNMYVYHTSYPPVILTRLSHINWDFNYMLAERISATLITAVAKSNPCLVTSTAHKMETGYITYLNGIVGMTELNYTFFRVTKIDANTFTLDGIDSSSYTTYVSGGVNKCVWFGLAGDNPSCGAFFEQRMILGGTINEPQTVWGSRSASYTDFILDPTEDDAALQYTIKSDSVDAIQWMIGVDSIIMGTFSGNWKLGASTTGEPITQSNVMAKKLTSYGCSSLGAVIANDVVLFVTRGGVNVKELVYSLAEDKMVANDLNLLASHITKGSSEALSGIVDMDYQQEPHPILWCVRNDGQLLGLLYERSQKIFGWFRVVTDGEVESVAVLPNVGKEDEVWITVKRDVNGTTYRFVEYFNSNDFWGIVEDYVGMDCSISFDGGDAIDVVDIIRSNPVKIVVDSHTFSDGNKVRIRDAEGTIEVNNEIDEAYTVTGSSATGFSLSGIDGTLWTPYTGGGTVQRVAKDISNLTYLEGEEVDILVDGAVHPSLTVESAALSLTWYGNKIHVGRHFTSVLIPQKLESLIQGGSTKNMLKRVVKIVVGFYQTISGKTGRVETSQDPIPFNVGTTPTLFTGPKEIPFRGDLSINAEVVITQDLPLPMTVLYIAPNMEVIS